MNSKTSLKLTIGGIAVFIALIALIMTVGVMKLEGNQAGIRQDWKKGVLDEVWRDGTHFYLGWTTDVYEYDVGTQKVTFDDDNPDAEYSRIIVNVGENGGQEARIAISANYRVGWESQNGVPVFSPQKLLRLHKNGIGKTYESVILKRTIIDVVNKIARPQQALAIYSGKGFVEFVELVDEALKAHKVFQENGIFIENTIVYKVYLDPAYEKEIAAKVLAEQTKLKKIEQTKSAEEEARRQFALSQADVEKRTQDAEAKKIESVKAAEALMESDKLEAVGKLALGEAEAKVLAMKRDAMYLGESGKRRAMVEIEIAKAKIYRGMLDGVTVLTDKSIARLGETSGVTSTNMTVPLD